MTKEEYKQMIVSQMEQNGNYDKAYDLVINQLVELQAMAYDVHEQLKTNPDVFISHTNKNGETKMIINPVWSVFFDLQRCICNYLDKLGLGLK